MFDDRIAWRDAVKEADYERQAATSHDEVGV